MAIAAIDCDLSSCLYLNLGFNLHRLTRTSTAARCSSLLLSNGVKREQVWVCLCLCGPVCVCSVCACAQARKIVFICRSRRGEKSFKLPFFVASEVDVCRFDLRPCTPAEERHIFLRKKEKKNLTTRPRSFTPPQSSLPRRLGEVFRGRTVLMRTLSRRIY